MVAWIRKKKKIEQKRAKCIMYMSVRKYGTTAARSLDAIKVGLIYIF